MTASFDDYERLRESRPALFVNPPGAWSVILEECPSEGGPYGVCYSDPYLTLLRDPVAFKDGRVGGYLRALHSGGHGGAAVLPVHDGRIVLLRHFRHSTRQWHWEIPRGFPEPGDSPERTARREVEEEIGASPSSIEFLGDVYADTGIAASKVGLFWAAVGEPDLSLREEGIDLIEPVTPERLDLMLEQGEITDSFTLAAVLHAKRRGLSPFA
ncbi:MULTISPECIES: NUDIX hydrolase [unclassified Actinomadura]|uniref:NUDIX hydrolase n=1 Tax=unclassified Actinomadura TaxID=2626254 RepID=UPI0011EDE980|nr:NUDIX hydrolase [Actinomadura sp. K4S16]